MKELEKLEKDMKPRLIEDLGMRYPTEKSTEKARYGLYECQYCGKEFETMVKSVKCGDTKSCGCVNFRITHGLTHHPLYGTWASMVKRCTNSKHKYYKNYGARGITVCEEWLDVRNFITWAEKTYPKLEGITLDRIDNNKGYSPDNCRWATREIQNTNQRVRSTNTSGFAGVSFEPLKNKWVAYICTNGINRKLGRFLTKEEAVQARDNYIIENKLPHKLSGLIKN